MTVGPPAPGAPGPSAVSDLRLVLASSSPRRRQLLGRLGVDFEIRVPDIDETPHPGEDPARYVERLARGKARAGQAWATGSGLPGAPDRAGADADPDEVVLGADTTVDVDGDIVGKPADRAEAVAMLARLAGRLHRVHTGVAVVRGTRLVSSVTTSVVTFAPLDDRRIQAYVDTGQAYDKAGGYSVLGDAADFVASIEGSASNVLGLPMAQTEALLGQVGFDPVRWGPPRPGSSTAEPGLASR